MKSIKPTTGSRHRVLVLSTLAALVLAACDKVPPAQPAPPPDAPAAAQPVPPAPAPAARTAAPLAQEAAPLPAYEERAQPAYTEYRAPIAQPAPIAVPWAPPPMRVEEIPPQPSPDANWTGGYWVWREGWAWAPGHWATPPRPRYHWVPPYYEHRADRVVFVDGFWSPPGVGFVRPAAGVTIALAVIGAAVAIGHPPVGPEGVFVPAPPGSRPGLFVPAPIGTAPAVVVRAPAIIAPGMRVNTTVNRIDNSVHENVRNTTVVNNITNVTIEAPASATANHQAVRVSVPSQPHLAAAMALREGAPQAPLRTPASPQPEPRAAQVARMPPQRDAEPARPPVAQPAHENAMKRALPVNRPAPAAPPTAPQMHTERAPVQAAPRAAEAAPPRGLESRPPRAPQPDAPAARPAAPPQAGHTAYPAPPPVRPERPADEAVHAEPARAAAPAEHKAPGPHPGAEKPKPAEPGHKPNGEVREENPRKEREPR